MQDNLFVRLAQSFFFSVPISHKTLTEATKRATRTPSRHCERSEQPMRGVSCERVYSQVTTVVAPQFAKEWKNDKRYCVSNKTCLVCCFGMTVANSQKPKFCLCVFFPFFRPPNFFEKGKGKFCFWGSPSLRGESGAVELRELPQSVPSVRRGYELPRALCVAKLNRFAIVVQNKFEQMI